jgi:hypothetical protein
MSRTIPIEWLAQQMSPIPDIDDWLSILNPGIQTARNFHKWNLANMSKEPDIGNPSNFTRILDEFDSELEDLSSGFLMHSLIRIPT